MSREKNKYAACAMVLATVLALASTSTFAGILVSGARITKVLNTRTANDASFVVFTEGGTGPCTGGWLYFYPTGASNVEIQKRAYSAALVALTTGMRVDIEAVDSSCLNAYTIMMYQ